MFKVAIVEDDPHSLENLTNHLKKYAQEKKVLFDIVSFNDGQLFINNTLFEKNHYDILFLDIELPGLNGIEVAKKYREFDEYTVLIFTTIMRQYAISGYLVNALDYMVKPIDYLNLSLKLDKALSILDKHQSIISLEVVGGGIERFEVKDLLYIENFNHLCTFHTKRGDYKQYNSMSNIEKEYAKYGLLRCSNSYIVNPINITAIKDDIVYINDIKLSIGRSKKKQFLQEVWKYI